MSGNKTLKMSNKALQYMYRVNTEIGASDIHMTRKVNKVFEAITQTVINFEQEEGKLMKKGQPMAQKQRGIEEKLDKIRRDAIEAKGIKENKETLEKELVEITNEVTKVEEEIKELYEKNVQVTIDRETLAFYFSKLEETVVNRKNQDGTTGPKGYKENSLFQEVYDSIEKVSK